MQRVKPIGLNLRNTDYEIADGFLQESINLQWRDNALKPIPERIETNIDLTGFENAILHKVSDENTINVLAFADGTPILNWIGTITDGTYVAKVTPVEISDIVLTDGMSFTILNGLIYFMGNGSTFAEQYYFQLKYSEGSDEYEVRDMYSWKDQSYSMVTSDKTATFAISGSMVATMGIILIRYALVLKSGEVVMHSPIYPHLIYAFMPAPGSPSASSPLPFENIMTHVGASKFYVNTDFDEEVLEVRVYATVPYYEEEYTRLEDSLYAGSQVYKYTANPYEINGEMLRLQETPFYEIATISKEEATLSGRDVMLYVDDGTNVLLAEFENGSHSVVEMSTIAAGRVMPIDNFSWHKIFGKITSYNNRLIIESPTTVFSEVLLEPFRANSDVESSSLGRQGYDVETEDGLIKSDLYGIDGTWMPKAVDFGSDVLISLYGIISYPDYRANKVLLNVYNTTNTQVEPTVADTFFILPISKLEGSNLSIIKGGLNFINDAISGITSSTTVPVDLVFNGKAKFNYWFSAEELRESGTNIYTSNNRVQFSQAGEFSTFPVENSYRVGEGKVVNVGANNINPSDTDLTSPLIVGTSDGVYSMNTDPTGNILIASITKIANVPYISAETLQIGNAIIFVSDKGLMAVENGKITNLTNKFFPDQGDGDRPAANTVYPNYNTLVATYFSGVGNPYPIIDVVEFMRNCIFAYDGRRNTIWCSGAREEYSMVYSLETGIWGLSTFKFTKKAEFFSTYKHGITDVIYSRYMVQSESSDNLYLLSGENLENVVEYHLLTRPIKLQSPDDFKKINRFYSRCELYADPLSNPEDFFVLGLWGKQDQNKKKEAIPLLAKRGLNSASFVDNVRQDIPVGRLSGKYKSIVILQGGEILPDSTINSFDFNVSIVKNSINK